MTRAELKALVLAFTDAFNRDDLDGVMAHMAEDAVYDEFNGHRAEGAAAIRKAFEPQFAGEFGVMRFREEDLIVDAEAKSAMISWTCTLSSPVRFGGWRGLDLLFFDDSGKVVRKETYAKTEKPAMKRLSR
ncbi:MAG: nuclear transport factor 2 family protein [Alphaproteobacteria bacterium]|jgi:ketosteroid isomerase-like protein|nr:nuclear transport factor 2 family protein [Alphaproteobacteria bacterium]